MKIKLIKYCANDKIRPNKSSVVCNQNQYTIEDLKKLIHKICENYNQTFADLNFYQELSIDEVLIKYLKNMHLNQQILIGKTGSKEESIWKICFSDKNEEILVKQVISNYFLTNNISN
ncbi:hypothetical protein [Metamycoplasma equirhinis]|uniref:hypothetical protein n=1 Tax=Metamycoplasma equirhinis TaxID=92402 RepID=UPI003592F8E8